MLPCLSQGDLVLTTSLTRAFHRGDIIVFTHRNNQNNFSVKRIIAMPGDKFQYYNESQKITLDSDQIFVLGDNIVDSLDSKQFGPIKINQIYTKVIFRVWPLKKIGLIS